MIEMPVLPDFNQVSILFTGGVESTLLAKMCVEKYGKDNVIFVLYAMDEYNVFYHDKEKLVKITEDFHSSVVSLGGYKTLIIDNEEYQKYQGWLADRTWQSIVSNYPSVQCMIGGYNNIHKECFDLFLEIDFPNNKKPSQTARLIVASEKKRYPEIWDNIYKCNGVIYFVEDDYTLKDYRDILSMYQHPNHCAPLYEYAKEDVIRIYEKLDWLDTLYKTHSCNDPIVNAHCGKCKNCLSRRLAFENSGIEDKTYYEL